MTKTTEHVIISFGQCTEKTQYNKDKGDLIIKLIFLLLDASL